MFRTTVQLPEELATRVRHEAKRRGISVSELTQEAISAYLGSHRKLAAAGAGRSGRDDISDRIEEILAGGIRPQFLVEGAGQDEFFPLDPKAP